MRRLIIGLVVVLALGTTATAALAASPHFKHGGEPVCTVSGGTSSKSVTCTGTLAGLGNEDLNITTTVRGFARYTCVNQGGNAAPGQNKVLVGPVTTPTRIPSGSIKNGSVTFTTNPAVLTAPTTVSGAEAGCPNDNWTGTNPRVTLTSITLRISQGGTLLFTCTASNPSGLSGTVPLSC
jgi:hypothetical protein